MTTATITTREALTAACQAHTTDELLGALEVLDCLPAPTEAQRLVRAHIGDTLEERHGLTAILDEREAEPSAATYRAAIHAVRAGTPRRPYSQAGLVDRPMGCD